VFTRNSEGISQLLLGIAAFLFLETRALRKPLDDEHEADNDDEEEDTTAEQEEKRAILHFYCSPREISSE